jgi:hypothetical protein
VGGGGRVKMATQVILPLPQEADSPPKQADSPPKWADLVKVAITSSKSHDLWGFVVKVAIFLEIPQRMGLARNLFSKMCAGNLYLPYCSVKICLPLSREL